MSCVCSAALPRLVGISLLNFQCLLGVFVAQASLRPTHAFDLAISVGRGLAGSNDAISAEICFLVMKVNAPFYGPARGAARIAVAAFFSPFLSSQFGMSECLIMVDACLRR